MIKLSNQWGRQLSVWVEIQDEILSFDSYEFSSIYEDARYSQKKVENRDYERMKGILDKQKKSSK